MSGRLPVPVRRDERGAVFYFVVLFALLAVAMTLSAAAAVQALLQDRPRARFALEATWAAQGGVEKARAELSRDPGWRGGAAAFGRSSAVVEVRPVEGDPGLREVISIGSVEGPGTANVAARCRVAATLRLGERLPAVLSWREGRHGGPGSAGRK